MIERPVTPVDYPFHLLYDEFADPDARLSVIDGLIELLGSDHQAATLVASIAESNHRRLAAEKTDRWKPVRKLFLDGGSPLELVFSIFDAVGVSDIVDQARRGANRANAHEGAIMDVLQDLRLLRFRLQPVTD
jgi:hypothetical protein